MENPRPHIGILKHEKLGYAEEILSQTLETAGLVSSVIKPQDLAFGDEEFFPDLLIARCELSSLSDPILSAYLAYFEECRHRGIPVINSREFLLRGQHKYLTHAAVRQYLQSQGLPDTINPPSYLSYNRDRAFELARREIDLYGSVVLKHPCSGRGDGIYLVRDLVELSACLQSHFTNGEAIMLQRTIEKEKNSLGGFRDIRVYACRDPKTRTPEVVSAFYRNAAPGQFLTNTSQGGFVTPMPQIDVDLIRFSKQVMEATQGDVAGLDFVVDSQGQYRFFEVNIAFETPKKAIDLVGPGIWEATRDLLVATLIK